MDPLRACQYVTLRFTVLLLLFSSTPGAAQTDMDVTWARIRTCAQLNQFEARFGSANRYGSRIAGRRRRLCERSVDRRPVPSRTPDSRLHRNLSPSREGLTASEVVNLYNKFWFCYDYVVEENSCRMIETATSRDSASLTLAQIESRSLPENSRSAWTYGELIPDRLRVIFHQELSIRGQMLCSSLEDRKRDAASLELIPMRENERGSLPETRLEETRTAFAALVGKETFDLACSRYKWASEAGSGELILEKEYYEGVTAQPKERSRIRLLSLGGPAPLLRMLE
jgi:hypothetical protein